MINDFGPCTKCLTMKWLDRCLCCGKELCDGCRLEHGRIATEIKKQRRMDDPDSRVCTGGQMNRKKLERKMRRTF